MLACPEVSQPSGVNINLPDQIEPLFFYLVTEEFTFNEMLFRTRGRSNFDLDLYGKFSILLDDNLVPVLIFWLKDFIDRLRGFDFKGYCSDICKHTLWVQISH